MLIDVIDKHFKPGMLFTCKLRASIVAYRKHARQVEDLDTMVGMGLLVDGEQMLVIQIAEDVDDIKMGFAGRRYLRVLTRHGVGWVKKNEVDGDFFQDQMRGWK